MGTFKINVDHFSWICGPEDDPDDLCLHGHVTVQIGKTVMEYDGTVSATALYLLKTLAEDKVMSEYDIQMVPCCGHFWVANKDLSAVTISGCDNGLDWSVVHENGGVRLILTSGQEEWVSLRDYQEEVIRFTDKVEAYYKSCKPKNVPDDEFSRNGYIAFWNEWRWRYNQAALKDALETGREVELRHGGLDYFIGRDQDGNWYLSCEQTKKSQTFQTEDGLYHHAKLGTELLKDQLAQIQIQYIL